MYRSIRRLLECIGTLVHLSLIYKQTQQIKVKKTASRSFRTDLGSTLFPSSTPRVSRFYSTLAPILSHSIYDILWGPYGHTYYNIIAFECVFMCACVSIDFICLTINHCCFFLSGLSTCYCFSHIPRQYAILNNLCNAQCAHSLFSKQIEWYLLFVLQFPVFKYLLDSVP